MGPSTTTFKFDPLASVESRLADETTGMKESSCCLLPCELWEEILSYAWLSEMEPAERRAFRCSMLLVSPQWHAVFIGIFLKNIYVDSLTDLRHVCKRWLLDDPPLINISTRPPLELSRSRLCTTITQQITSPKLLDEAKLHKLSARCLLDTFRQVPYLPNLRTLSVTYHFTYSILTQTVDIVHLQLEYEISPRTAPWVAEELGLAGGRWLHADARVAKLEHVSFAQCAPDTAHARSRQQADLGEFLQANRHLRHAVDKDGWLRVCIRGASRALPRDAVVVHGAIVPEYDAAKVRRCLRRDGSMDLQRMGVPRVVRGTALGFVFDAFRYDRDRCALDDESILDQWRDVRIFGC